MSRRCDINNIYRKPQWKKGNCGGFSMDTNRVPPPVEAGGIHLHELWHVKYDGQHIMRVMIDKPKMTVKEIITIIESEGGSVDEHMVIHRGN